VPLVVLTGHNNPELALKAVREGAQDFLLKDKINAKALQPVIEYAGERHRKNTENEHLTYHDALTDLPNRALLTHTFKNNISLAERNGTMVAIHLIDLDGFKAINDTYGHAIGDKILRHVASQLKKCVRRSDLAGRLGGDEFMVIQNNFSDLSQVLQLSQRLVQFLEKPIKIPNLPDLAIGCSIGISVYPDHSRDPTDLFKLADIALYKSKETDGSCYRFYNDAC